MLRWLQRDKRTRAPQTPAPAAPEQALTLSEAVSSVVDAMAAGHAAQIAALAAQVDALKAQIGAYEERAAHLSTRINSLQGSVNRKLGLEAAPEQRGPPVVLLGGANGGR